MANLPEWIKAEWVEKHQKELSNLRVNESRSESFLKTRREIVAYGRALLLKNQIPEQKFVIFGQPRTGSTLLVELLNSHPKIHCENEILNAEVYKKVLFPSLYVQGRCAKFPNKVYAFKIIMFQLPEEHYTDPEQFMLNLSDQGWKIINTIRNDSLRSVISVMVAISRKQWHSREKNSFKNQKVSIDCHRLIELLERREIYQAKEQEILDKLDHIKVIYEKDLLLAENHQKTSDRVFDYLGLESVPVETKLLKVTSNQLSDVIENYAEVVENLRATKYAKLLSN